MRQILATMTVLGLFAIPSAAQEVTPELLKKEIHNYQKGDTWSTRKITDSDRQDPIIKRALEATVLVNGATGIYLGKFNSQHVVATNAHVANSYGGCELDLPKVIFNAQIWSETTSCLGVWTDIELALLIVKPYDIAEYDGEMDRPSPLAYEKGEQALKGKGVNFNYDKFPRVGSQLLNVGHGYAGNDDPERLSPIVISEPRITEDKDCRVLSQTGDVRFLFDPDVINPLNYSAWSIADACDTSHGSSGSMLMNRQTGELVSIVWTGVWTKETDQPISSAEIDTLSHTQNAGIWTRLNYSVPGIKIKQYLLAQIKAKKIKGKKKALIKAILEEK